MRTGTHRWLPRAALGIAVILTALPACSSGRSVPPGATVEVRVRDFHIHLSSAQIPSGVVDFDVHNQGPSTHEFVVVKTQLPASQLPLQSDGLTVDEKSPSLQDVDEISDLDIGDSQVLPIHLPPGRYVLFCNLEGHYLGGMYVSLRVA